jgi:predicted permease
MMHTLEPARDAGVLRWFADAIQDLRFAIRTLRKNPGFAIVAVLTLALGIGANTAIFTLFDAILLRSLPVRDPTRLVLFSDSVSEGTSTGNPPRGRWELFSYEAYEYLRRQRLPYESLAAVRSGDSPVSVHVKGESSTTPQVQRAQAQLVSGNYFRTMGVEAALGRMLTTDDDRRNASPAAVVRHAFWRQSLHSNPAAIGTVAILNGTAFTIVGVAPPEFFGERVRRPPDFWVPLAFQPQIELRSSYVDRADAYWLKVIGRLAPNATRALAQTATTVALRQFLTSTAGTTLTPERELEIQKSYVELADGARGISTLRRLYSEPLHVLLVVVALVLLIACANVGNLLLTRATARRSEMSMRIALGAGRGRLVRQLLAEGVLLATLAAACGILLARWVVNSLLALVVSQGSPVRATIDGSVLAFTIAIAAPAALLFGLAPAMYAWRTDLASAIKTAKGNATLVRRRRGASHLLVAAQIAISLVLLVGANLFARSLLNLQTQPLGFDANHVLLVRVNPRLAGYQPADTVAAYRRLYDRLNTLPGVSSATLARYSPLGGSRSARAGSVDGYTPKPGESVSLETVLVGPSYPETLGIPLIQGRAINLQDTAGRTKVAMVNQAFVRQYFPRENPIGRHFGVGGSTSANDIEIVGILGDAQFHDARDPVGPIAFTSLLQDVSQFALDCEIEVRAIGDPAAVSNEVRKAVAEVDPNLPMNEPRTLREQIASTFGSQRLAAELVAFFGVLALTLACVGLYGTIAQIVIRRTGEIGVRMVLGAGRQNVLWMIMRQTLALLAIGIVVGVPSSFAAARLVAHQLFGVTSADPASFALAVGILSVVAVLAGLVPARRATRVNLLIALRSE